MVSVTPEACFTPARVPPPRAHAAADQPREWRGSVAVIEAGKRMVVPRGAKTGDGQYEHVHVRQGTIEFWLRADTSDDSVENLSFLRFGRLNLWRRTQLGTYFNLGKGFLQSGFLIRPRVWYHVALTWDVGGEGGAARINLFLEGLPVMAGMQEALPADTGDWTGDALEFGTAEPMRVCGLRISSVARDQELQRGSLSPAPDAQTLYWQEGK